MEISEMYEMLFKRMGDLGWWPADSPDEVVIGAILTQNTSWKNVEKALSELRGSGKLTLDSISHSEKHELSTLIRSSGFYNQKAGRLKDLSERILAEYGSLENMSLHDTPKLTEFLQPIKGIGQETLDSILLYALEKPVFVIDKYAVRIFSRTGLFAQSEIQNGIRDRVENELAHNVRKLKNFHAMLVQLAKDHCRKNPLCEGCPLSASCNYHREIMFP